MTYLVGNHPFVRIKLKLPKKGWRRFNCLVDTGFSGGISLPESFKQYFPKTKFIETHFVLADNSEVTVDTTIALADYKRNQKETAVVFMAAGEPLVGVEFLDQMRFCLDLKERQVELT